MNKALGNGKLRLMRVGKIVSIIFMSTLWRYRHINDTLTASYHPRRVRIVRVDDDVDVIKKK